MQHSSVPAPPPLTLLWEKPCQQGIQPSQKPRGNAFKNTSRKHLDASYNLLPDYTFCHDSSVLDRLSLPTLQKLGGEGAGYRESGKSVDKMDTSTAKSCSFHMQKEEKTKGESYQGNIST